VKTLLVLGVPVAILAGAALATASCDSGLPANSGVAEPLVVSGGQFVSGDLPGTAPDAGPEEPGDAVAPLSVLQVTYTNNVIVAGTSGESFSGVVTDDAVAVGMRFANEGTGYWVVPVGISDPVVPNASDFSLKASFDIDDPPGPHPLLAVAIGAAGNGGTQYVLPLCIESRVPDNGHACNPKAAVPVAVFSLQWDVNFDVDLHVIAPNGVDINPKTALLMYPVDAGAPPASDPKIDRDSLRNCVPDDWHEEDLVFQDQPAPGTYQIYADPFTSCGQAAVHFQMTIYEAQSDGSLAATYTQGGELLANDTTGGASMGLFIAEKVFNN
jgi:hypothetical protein